MFGNGEILSQLFLAEDSQRIELWKFEVLNLKELSAELLAFETLLLVKNYHENH